MVVERGFASMRYLVRDVLKEAGDAVVLEPDDARAAVREAAETIRAANDGRHRGLTRVSGTLRADAAPEGPDPFRRQGHAPAPDYPHERQAARPGGEQAGAVLRDRGDGAGRDRGGGDHHRARDRRGDPRGRRRRLAVRGAAELHPAGRAGRARACGADRGAVPGRRAVRHVPGRQPPAGRDRGSGGDLPCARAGRDDPAHAGARPRVLRRRGALGWRGGAAGREAARAADRSRAGRRVHVHLVRACGGEGDQALGAGRARDHRRDPAPGRRGPAGRAAHRQGLVEGHRAPG